MHYRSEMMAMETRYLREINVSEEKHQKQIEEMAELNKNVIAHNEKMYEKCQRIVKEMQADQDEKQEDIMKELRSQLEERDGRHRRLVARMTAEYLKVMEDTSELQRYMMYLENLNRCDQKEHDDVGQPYRNLHPELSKEVHRQKVRTVGDCHKDVEYMIQRVATKRKEGQRQKEHHAAELARPSARNDGRLSTQPVPLPRIHETTAHSNNNVPTMEKFDTSSWRFQRPPFGDVATLRAWLASHRPPSQGPIKVLRPVSDFAKQPSVPSSGRMSSFALRVM